MKKIMFLTVIAFMSIFIGSMEVKAQPCDGDDCVNAAGGGGNWTDEVLAYYPDPVNCPECWVDIYYKVRDNEQYENICPNAPRIEFQIKFVVVSGACLYPCNGNPPIYDMGDGEAPYIDALIKLMEVYAPAPGNGQCGDVVPNYETVDCKKTIIAPNGDEYIWNCESDECCVQNLQLCLDANGNPRLSINSIYAPTVDCVPDPDGNDCTSSCLWRQEVLVPKIGIDAKDKMADMSKYNVTLVQANGYSGASLNIEGKLDGALTIYLFDIDGNVILNKTSDVKGDSYHHQFNGNLSTGTYIYSVYHNGLMIKVGKFNIAY